MRAEIKGDEKLLFDLKWPNTEKCFSVSQDGFRSSNMTCNIAGSFGEQFGKRALS